MSEVEKQYYQSTTEYKLFGIKFFESNYTSSCYNGSGDFISSSIPNKEYFDREFRNGNNNRTT